MGKRFEKIWSRRICAPSVETEDSERVDEARAIKISIESTNCIFPTQRNESKRWINLIGEEMK